MPGRALSKGRIVSGVFAAAMSLLLSAAPVYAHGGAVTPGKSAAQAETEHLHEHEIIGYWEAKIRQMSASQKAAYRHRALQQPTKKQRGSSLTAKRLQDQPVGPASTYGAWTAGPFRAPTFGIHVVMLPTGRVLLMSMGDTSGAGLTGGSTGQDVNNNGNAAVWDPSRGTGPDSFRILPPPPMTLDDPQRRRGYNKLRPAPVYCSGHVQLADGRVFVAGGNLESSGGGYGLKMSFLFDPWTETWVRQPDLVKARWYPTLVRLGNGKVAIIAGQDEQAVNRPEIEIYPADGAPVPGIDTSDELTAGTTVKTTRKLASYYPLSYVLPDGRLAIVGPTEADQGILNTNTWTWSNTIGFRTGANAYPSFFPAPGTVNGPDKVYATGGLSTGGYLQPLVSSIRPGIDARWTVEPTLQLSRRNAPSVLLPDGSVVTVGGGYRILRDVDPAYLWPTRRQPELWDPVTHKWRLGPAQQRPRGYHSSAVLLPDGRVMSTGDDLDSVLFDDNLKDQYPTTIELYSPPYLFKGPRPVIESAPERADYGQQFTFTVDGDAAAIDRVTVVAPGSNTHAMDMNQRQLELRIVGRSENTITVVAPPTAGAAPPGDYMLFALSAAGVPSVAKFIAFLPTGAAGHPPAASAPDWGGPPATPTPTPAPTPTPLVTPIPTATPKVTPTPTATPTPKPTATPTPTPAPVTKAPRPWWWPWFLPWTG